MKGIPVISVAGRTLAEAYEKALVELAIKGMRVPTQYDKPGDPPSLDATADITVLEPMSDPMIHKAFPGGIADLREYVMELEGAKDSWTKKMDSVEPDTRWEYTYHGRLAKYGGFKNVHGKQDSVFRDGPVMIGGDETIDQFGRVVSKLAKQPFTRQAQMITWMPSLDLYCYDPPCLQRIWLRVIEDGETWWLNYDVSFRSNDAWGAYMMNSFGITMMVDSLVARPLAAATGKTVALGRMNWHADSWHVYGKDIAQFSERLFSRLLTTRFEDRVINFHDPDVREMYDECVPEIEAKIARQNASMEEQDGRTST